MQSQQTGERTGSRPSAAEGGGAPAPALRPADHRAISTTQLLLGVPGFLATIADDRLSHLTDLTPTTGASGPHDFTVRISRARQSRLPRPSHPHPQS